MVCAIAGDYVAVWGGVHPVNSTPSLEFQLFNYRSFLWEILVGVEVADSSTNKNSANSGSVIGGILGALVFIVLIVEPSFFVCHRNQRQKQSAAVAEAGRLHGKETVNQSLHHDNDHGDAAVIQLDGKEIDAQDGASQSSNDNNNNDLQVASQSPHRTISKQKRSFRFRLYGNGNDSGNTRFGRPQQYSYGRDPRLKSNNPQAFDPYSPEQYPDGESGVSRARGPQDLVGDGDGDNDDEVKEASEP
ncbi:MAG: hypothetical protein J3R72DRAFT_484944 [Linnemannia gamsii]|nr:MAG: hypothetical protein J3R72DRAFT_484944 [Linnemannia gamsii]